MASRTNGVAFMNIQQTKRAVIYARVSTDEQREEGYSIASQIASCIDFAESHGYQLVGNRYVDQDGKDIDKAHPGAVPAFVDDYSGLTPERPAIAAVQDYLGSYGFEILIVYYIDRLGREYARYELERWFSLKGVKVEYVIGGYDDTLSGRAKKEADDFIARIEGLIRLERVMRGKRQKAKRGLFVSGRAPYGYRIDKSAQPGGLAVIESEASIVQRIFDLYVNQDHSIRRIINLLNSEDIPTPLSKGNGKKRWGISTINRILSNEMYIGIAYYNKNIRRGKRLELRDRQEWIEFAVTPIVDPASFAAAQLQLKQNKDLRRRQLSSRHFYLLSGMVTCGNCGRAYGTETKRAGFDRRKNDAPSYRHRIKLGHCLNRVVSGRWLDQVVWEYVVDVLLDSANLRQGYAENLAQQESRRKKCTAQLDYIRQQLGKLGQKLDNLTEAYIDPVVPLSKEEYLRKRGPIDLQIKALKNEREVIEAEVEGFNLSEEIEALERFAEHVQEYLAKKMELPMVERRHILEMLHTQVIIEPDGEVRIRGWFNPPSSGKAAGKLSHMSAHYGSRPPRSPARASHAPDL